MDMENINQTAPFSEPKSRKATAAGANTDTQVFTPPYVLDSGRAKAVIRQITISNGGTATATVIVWDEDLDGSQPNAKRGTNAAPIIPKIYVPAKDQIVLTPQNDSVFIQYGFAFRSDDAATDVMVEYDLQM